MSTILSYVKRDPQTAFNAVVLFAVGMVLLHSKLTSNIEAIDMRYVNLRLQQQMMTDINLHNRLLALEENNATV